MEESVSKKKNRESPSFVPTSAFSPHFGSSLWASDSELLPMEGFRSRRTMWVARLVAQHQPRLLNALRLTASRLFYAQVFTNSDAPDLSGKTSLTYAYTSVPFSSPPPPPPGLLPPIPAHALPFACVCLTLPPRSALSSSLELELARPTSKPSVDGRLTRPRSLFSFSLVLR